MMVCYFDSSVILQELLEASGNPIIAGLWAESTERLASIL
jgi:hypothetical protein